MKVLFRAEVKDINSKLTNAAIENLTKIGGKFYAIGSEIDLKNEYGIIDENEDFFECKKETRSINFEDMKDSEDNPIFASLSEDGKGGDIIDSEEYPFTSDGQKNYNAVVSMIFNQPQYVYNKISENVSGASDGINNGFDEEYSSFKVIGIQK